jgi:transposase
MVELCDTMALSDVQDLFSLIETAKANGLEPYSYLRCLFEQLPLVKDQDGCRGLLPQYIDRDLINAAR